MLGDAEPRCQFASADAALAQHKHAGTCWAGMNIGLSLRAEPHLASCVMRSICSLCRVVRRAARQRTRSGFRVRRHWDLDDGASFLTPRGLIRLNPLLALAGRMRAIGLALRRPGVDQQSL